VPDIRTPDDEITRKGYFYPPFKEGWWYQGQTYGGHSDFSVDWNRRTKDGQWLNDLGDPVLAAADGTVSEIDRDTGTVYVTHFGGLYRTESRHMRIVSVKLGQKVQRGDKLGEIGAAGISPSSGFIPSPHLHHVHFKRDSIDEPWGDRHRIKQSFYDKPVIASVHDSDSQPRDGWNPPGPVMIQGPAPKATWEGAFREASLALTKANAALADARNLNDVLKGERDDLSKDLAALRLDLAAAEGFANGYRSQVMVLEADLASAEDRIEILESGQNLDEVRRAARESFKNEVLNLPA
jgi:hypothetical protein